MSHMSATEEHVAVGVSWADATVCCLFLFEFSTLTRVHLMINHL